MSTLTSLERNEKDIAPAQVVCLSSAQSRCMAAALADDFSRRILYSTVHGGKTLLEISVEQAIPLSTCYRRARELVDQGLLVVQRIVITREGKKYAIYRSSFRDIRVTLTFEGVSAAAELNRDVAEKLQLKWLTSGFLFGAQTGPVWSP